jgi:phage anti-repressor protein
MSSASEDVSRFNAENATAVATDFLKRLGYKRGLLPKKVSLAEQIYTVEIDIDKKAAKVQIDSKTKEIREYEIQEAELNGGFLNSKMKMLLIVIPIVAVIAGLKVMGIF